MEGMHDYESIIARNFNTIQVFRVWEIWRCKGDDDVKRGDA